ncbi:Fic family protein [Methylobacter svalbardensis]|uniref:Fic family protein n=1 Tax=Methylobacter svalbardensis TaxID=3080016 RepID=UPI0030EEFA3D
MIFNNYQAMQLIRDYKEEKLTPAMILQLHRLLTEATLDDANKAGQYRDAGDDIHLVDASESVLLHIPPEASELPDRIERLCQFANDLDGKEFIHPVIRAIILHFMIGYDHPFVDGNGRTARALYLLVDGESAILADGVYFHFPNHQTSPGTIRKSLSVHRDR